MNSELPLTRRDVLAIVLYAALGCNLLSSLLALLCQFAAPRIPLLQSSISRSNAGYYAVNAGFCFVFALALLPFVSLIANGVVGRIAPNTSTGKRIVSLVFRCCGLLLFVTSLPHFAVSLYTYWQSMSIKGAPSSIGPIYLQYVFAMLVSLSVGFIFAFFPAIFASLRGQDEESAT